MGVDGQTQTIRLIGPSSQHINLCIIGTSHECHDILNHWQLQCLFNNLLMQTLKMQTSKKTSKVALQALCEGNPPGTGGFPSQRPVMWKVFPCHFCHHVDRVI